MKDLVLINPLKFENSIKKSEVVSLEYLKSFLVNKGYSVDIYDFQILSDDEIDEVIKNIAYSYCIVGISCYFPYNPLDLARCLKSYNEKLYIFCGGPMASLRYNDFLYNGSPIDLIAINEGEWTLLEIMNQYFSSKAMNGITGTAFIDNGELKYKNRKFEKDLDKFSFPCRSNGHFKLYIPTIVSSRGCNGKCKFCSTRYTGYWRGRSPEDVYTEIQHIVIDHKQKYFQFIEPNFLGIPERALKIAELIKLLPTKVYFDFAGRIDSIYKNPTTIEQLKNAGAIKVLLGIENFSDKVLEEWKKDITCDEIEKAISVLNKFNLSFSASFILFHPKTTKEELLFNINKIETLNIINKTERLYNKLILIPGTVLNNSKDLKMWDFENADVKEIYDKCILFQKNIDSFMKNIEDYIINEDDKLSCLIKAFDICISRKNYEFNYLKSLLLNREYIDVDISLKNPRICINKELIIENSLDGNVLLINSNTGIIYEVSNISFNIVKRIHNTHIVKLCIEILDYYKINSNDTILLIKYVFNLMNQGFLIFEF